MGSYNRIEKAIDWFLHRKQNITICDKCSEMEEIALEALQKKSERENPQPLTLDELRQMVGEPVYMIHGDTRMWIILHKIEENIPTMVFYNTGGYGTHWINCKVPFVSAKFYRHKPKEEEK